ncbi:MAG: class I SAM-dependent methyltransferase [Bacillota bacterium]
MKKSGIAKEMLHYYEERAGEYDLVYQGRVQTSLDSGLYPEEAAKVGSMVRGFGSGHLIDIACGSGFWFPFYALNCRRFTFIDQSRAMLDECRKKVGALSAMEKAEFIQGDIFRADLPENTYEAALAGFLLSHFTRKQENAFFRLLDKILKPEADLMIIDSSWSPERQSKRAKEGIQERALEDGRKFRIYKKYYAETEIPELMARFGFQSGEVFFGAVFLAVKGKRI